MTNIEPKLELVAERTNDMPERVIVCATPGVPRVISSTRAMISWVRWSEAESGSWTFTMSRPWS